MFQEEQEVLEEQILNFCSNNNLPEPDKIKWSPIPFDGHWGISTSFFSLAAQEARLKNSPTASKVPVPQRAQQIAARAADQISLPEGFSSIEAKNGYLNVYFSTAVYSRRVVDTVLLEGADFGCVPLKNKRVMVEFSQPNTHKAFHVGHLRNAILGAVICNILECSGFEVIRANYIGDIGLHVIKWMWNYKKYHDGEQPHSDRTRWMGDIYAEADRRLDENPELEEEVRELFSRWDKRDPEVVELWKTTRQWSLEGFNQIYELLDVHFDRIYYESEVEDPGKELVDDLIAQGIAVDERPDGPVIIRIDDLLNLDKEKYRVLVILRSDGTSLYATKDLPLAIQKFEEYNLDRSIYVIDVRQGHYLQQIYKTLEIMGYPWAKDCYHLAYEIVNLPGNVTMSSRDGTVVLLEDLVSEATTRAFQIVEEKNPSLNQEEKQAVAEAVALGALKYTMLSRDNVKIVTFDWDSALDFDGQAAPYVQYAHVRANSILRKAGLDIPESIIPEYHLHPSEIQLIDLISRVPGEIERAADDLKPLHLTNLVYEIARSFSDFYNQCPVIKAKQNQKLFRLRMVAATRQTIANLLGLLGIHAPAVM